MASIGGETPPVWLIAGPTASGKSALAVTLAERIDAEIINADAIQLYADLNILTARPDPVDLARVPHHLYGVADGADGWSVGRWLRAVTPLISEIAGRGRRVVIVGGTGLYFRALTVGLADALDVSAEARTQAQDLLEEEGEAAFRAHLARLDPAAEARIARNDRQRLVRALSVANGTGRALSDWQANTSPTLQPDQWRGLVLTPPREALYQRCDVRVEKMLEAGALDEVAALAARGLGSDLPVTKAVGYRELAGYLSGACDRASAIAATQQETRRYAKRQSTWFRNQTPDWPRIEAVAPRDQAAALFTLRP